MWKKVREFLRKEVFKTRDVIPPVVGVGLSIGVWVAFIALILVILLIIAGIVFAIVSIVKASKKKKKARLEAGATGEANTTEATATE